MGARRGRGWPISPHREVPSYMGYHHIEYRTLGPVDEAVKAAYEAFLMEIEQALDDPECDRNELCRRTLAHIYLGPRADELLERETTDPASAALLASFDPRNITMEPEYYGDIDKEQYYPRKPLIWLWVMFDRSPLGQNAWLGHRLRAILARKVFKSCGKNPKIWHFVEISYGYNITVGDNVVIHRHVLLDDRGGIDIGNDVSISDFANVYSHSHDIEDINNVSLDRTVIGDGCRVTYHATVLAGTTMGRDSMVGCVSVVTKDVGEHHVNVGIPARHVATKKAGRHHPESTSTEGAAGNP